MAHYSLCLLYYSYMFEFSYLCEVIRNDLELPTKPPLKAVYIQPMHPLFLYDPDSQHWDFVPLSFYAYYCEILYNFYP